MARKIKIRTRMQEEQPEVLVLIKHPMETGLRIDKKTKKKIPAHFIKNVIVELNGKVVTSAELGIGISQNPVVGFRLKEAKTGDKLKVSWNDNTGEQGALETVVEL